MKHFIPRLVRKLGVARYLNQMASISENGIRFRIPLLGEHGYSNLNLSEPWMTELLQKTKPMFASDSALFMDVGANIGQTLIKLRSVLPNMPYVGFEPNPTCVFYMNALVRANDFRSVEVFPFGLSDVPAILSLHLYSDHDADSAASLIDEFRSNEKVYRSIHVPVFPVSAVSLRLPVAFLKIDVEGSEWEVLQSVQAMLARDKPMILTEILPCYRADNHARLDRQRKIENLLRGLSYECYRVLRREDRIDYLWKLEEIEIHSRVPWSDYLWVSTDRAPSLAERITVKPFGPGN
ncbi:MAG: FkbM family methyltransferase [Planctomycetota bacterium]